MSNLPLLVTSLELSKRLKELGVKQDSLFYWENINEWKEDWETRIEYGIYDFDCPHKTLCSAYTAGELGEILLDWTSMISYFDFKANTESRGQKYEGDLKNWHAEEYGIYENTEADCRAKLLIHLLTSNLINIKG